MRTSSESLSEESSMNDLSASKPFHKNNNSNKQTPPPQKKKQQKKNKQTNKQTNKQNKKKNTSSRDAIRGLSITMTPFKSTKLKHFGSPILTHISAFWDLEDCIIVIVFLHGTSSIYCSRNLQSCPNYRQEYSSR